LKPAEFFPDAAAWRAWLVEHHATAQELWVGFHRVASGQPTLTWPQSVDEALCFGWIDGVRQRVDEHRYRIRFTPRRATSIWSAVNVARMGELIAAGRVAPAGMAAFARRREQRSGIYSYEQRAEARLAPAEEATFRHHPEAWEHFQARPPGYRRTAIHWVTSAKREDTRRRRLAQLIAVSAAGRPLPQLDRTPRET
jgi:uncharacterized protein YdeI (YjbR/CyaY-like superfamily)